MSASRNSDIEEVHETTPVASSRKQLSISRDDLTWLSAQGFFPADKVEAMWGALAAKVNDRPRFDLPHVAWYSGATLVIIAMAIFLGFTVTSPGTLLATSVLYMGIFAGAGLFLNRDRSMRVPAGLLTTLSVVMTPVAVFALMGLGTHGFDMSHQQAIIVSLSTMAAGGIALALVRFPFITAPIYGALWVLTMTIMDMVMTNSHWGSNDHLVVTMLLGGLIIGGSFAVDRRTKEDYSFWGYFFGLLSLWGAWTFLDKGGDAGNFVYFLTNVGLMLVSVALQRRVFLVFGSLGAVGYIVHLAADKIQDPLGFAAVLVLLGIAVIAAGIGYHKHRMRIEQAILKALPDAFGKRTRRTG